MRTANSGNAVLRLGLAGGDALLIATCLSVCLSVGVRLFRAHYYNYHHNSRMSAV